MIEGGEMDSIDTQETLQHSCRNYENGGELRAQVHSRYPQKTSSKTTKSGQKISIYLNAKQLSIVHSIIDQNNITVAKYLKQVIQSKIENNDEENGKSYLTKNDVGSKKRRVHVWFTEQQYTELEKHSELSGKKIADVIRHYLTNKNVRISNVPKSTANSILSEVGRIGNNINQVAKKLNEYRIEDYDNQIEDIKVTLSNIYNSIMRIYGIR